MERVKKIRDLLIYRDRNYNSFPNVIRTSAGDLMLAFRTADDPLKKYGEAVHIDPSSKIVFIRSRDNGNTWDEKVTTIFNDEQGEQDPCLNILSDGTILCTFFKWKVVPINERKTLGSPEIIKYFCREISNRWAAVCSGAFCMCSVDNGESWEGPWEIQTSEYVYGVGVRGNVIELKDGSIILPMYGVKRFGELARSYIMRSQDRGRRWEYVSDIAHQKGKNFLEPFIYKTDSGRIVAFLRTQSDFRDENFEETYLNLHTAFSTDNGQTWSRVREEELFCPNPVHVLRLSNENVLLTYGYRRQPYGIRARLLGSECDNLAEAEEIVLRDDAGDADVGYPCSIAVDERSALVTYYFTDRDDRRRYIAGTIVEIVKGEIA